jgi:hypothetical protein
MRVGHLLKRACREFLRNMIWMSVIFGPLVAVLIPAADLPLLGVLAFIVVSVSIMAAILTVVVLWSGAHDETHLGGHNHPGVPPGSGDFGGWHGGGWDGGGGGGDGGGGGG